MTTETKPKVAVLVNGNYHDYLRLDDLEKSLIQIKKTFKDCDIYYQTWEVDRKRFEGICHLVDLDYIPHPKPSNYDPYGLVRRRVNKRSWGGLRRFSPHKQIETRTSCFQHLSFAHQWSRIPKKYDYYVRCRWDLHICPDFPLDEMLKLCDKRVVGIQTKSQSPKRADGYPLRKEYDWVKKYRRGCRDKIDRGQYSVTGDHDNFNSMTWDHFLCDFMIFFKGSDLENVDIDGLYKNGQLMCAEFGWHQILCGKRLHYNIDGLVGILRNTDYSWETYLKLREHKLL